MDTKRATRGGPAGGVRVCPGHAQGGGREGRGRVAPAARVAHGRPLDLQAHGARRAPSPWSPTRSSRRRRTATRSGSWGSSPRSRASGPSISTWWRRRAADGTRVRYDPPALFFSWPFKPGDTWAQEFQYTDGRNDGRYANTWKVGAGVEPIDTVAGRFYTLRVERWGGSPAARGVLVQPQDPLLGPAGGLPAWVPGGVGGVPIVVRVVRGRAAAGGGPRAGGLLAGVLLMAVAGAAGPRPPAGPPSRRTGAARASGRRTA